MMKFICLHLLILFTLSCNYGVQSLIRRRQTRHIGGNYGRKGVSAPLLGDETDLETIEGVEQATKLVLIKTDSLPGESDERIDGRYLNSLMETLYTGLRKPFKSVSADILGIFPSFEEIQVRCDKSESGDLERGDKTIIRRDHAYKQAEASRNETFMDDHQNETVNNDGDSSYSNQNQYKSSMQVCRAVTDDCLSMDNLVQILPPSATTFNKVLVRLCPIMLFRIMNDICQKSRNPFNERLQEETMLDLNREEAKDSNIKEQLQILKNLQSSDDLGAKRPQKLHKKLKTQSPYKNGGRLNAGGLQEQHGSVDEQLLKIRLKLTEPSIEKVWIFSLLFVILSIVVSMGGLIVLPFVKKTTRRRILTLFEGLAVGGLAGSATLHMFPQAFGLVDENYHKYFWRIFVVFFGIYLCYLCERIIKILKVMRAKMEKRSRASLIEIDMDLCYGFPSVSREISKSRSKSSRLYELEEYHMKEHDEKTSQNVGSRRQMHDSCRDCLGSITKGIRGARFYSEKGHEGCSNSKKMRAKKYSKRKSSKSSLNKVKEEEYSHRSGLTGDSFSTPNEIDSFSSMIGPESNPTRQRLIRCLKSVQSQFSPVYAVQTPISENSTPLRDEPKAARLMRLMANNQENANKSKTIEKQSKKVKRARIESTSIFRKIQSESKPSMKKYMKQRDIETMLYHRSMDARYGHHRPEGAVDQRFLQQRLSTVDDVAAERQDQDNAARMSVDTVAWMIVFGDAVLNVIDGLSIGAAFERNILAGISISVAVMLEEVTHRLGTFAVLIRAGMSMQQSLLCTFLSACALFPGLIVGILLSDATEDATPYIFCAAGGIFLYMALVDVMKEMNRSIENAIRKDIKSTLQIFALQNVGIVVAVIFLSFLALYEQAMDFEEYQKIQYNQPSINR